MSLASRHALFEAEGGLVDRPRPLGRHYGGGDVPDMSFFIGVFFFFFFLSKFEMRCQSKLDVLKQA